MDSFHRRDTQTLAQPTPVPNQLQAWRLLPRLLVSRRWRWFTLGAFALALVFIRLGLWQLNRLEQRQVENAIITSRITGPPVELKGQQLDIESNEYRRVTVRGSYDHSQEIVLRNRSRDGVPGVDVITPLRITGSNQSVLVNRGWVPLLQYDAAEMQQFVAPGEVIVEGIARRTQPGRSNLGPQDNVPEGGELRSWFRVDIERIQNQVPYPLLPFFVEQLPREGAPELPYPQPSTEVDEGSHLSYAIQWFSFALIGLCGYAALVVTRTQEQQAAKAQAMGRARA